MNTETRKDTILTGLRVNSELHLGHYLGVIAPFVRTANAHPEMDVNMFIPDLHSIISPIEGDLTKNAISNMKVYLAAGLKVGKNVHFYRQSRVPAHAELCWVLDTVATMGELQRMTQFKDKSEKGESTNVGIFNYPVLMAADILLYSAKYVPVGEDQFQHIELARNLAQRFNSRFGETFVLPEKTEKQMEFMHQNAGVRIRDLVNPEKKMSKSTPGENTKIMLSDDPQKVRKKIMSATTDSFGEIRYDYAERPGISNLLTILAILSEREIGDVVSDWEGKTQYGELKTAVADAVEKFLIRFQEVVRNITDTEAESYFENGEEYARRVAGKKLNEVYRRVGLV